MILRRITRFFSSHKQRFQQAKKAVEEVSKIQIPIEAVTEQTQLKQMIELRRKQMTQNFAIAPMPQNFRTYLSIMGGSLLLMNVGIFGAQMIGRTSFVPYIYGGLINLHHVNVCGLSGLVWGQTAIQHNLSINTVRSTPEVWTKAICAMLPLGLSAFLMVSGYQSLYISSYFSVMYILQLAYMARGSAQVPNWFRKYITLYIMALLGSLAATELFLSGKKPEDLQYKMTVFDSIRMQIPKSLKLSQIAQ